MLRLLLRHIRDAPTSRKFDHHLLVETLRILPKRTGLASDVNLPVFQQGGKEVMECFDGVVEAAEGKKNASGLKT